MKNVILTAALCFSMLAVAQEDHNPKQFFNGVEKSDMLILGTFHFKDAGLDGYKPKHDINILSEDKQKELAEVLEALKRYGPTKIAVEMKKERQPFLDSLYNEYLAGRYELKANEIYQIGFRLGKMMGHKKIYAIDVWGRDFDEFEYNRDVYNEKSEFYTKKATPEQLEREKDLDSRFRKLYERDDELKTTISLTDNFLYMNDPDRLRLGHGHYIIGSFKMGENDDYFGPDAAIGWYSRNLRIYYNVLKITEPGKDKIFLLIGAGHGAILNFLLDSSPDYNKREFKEFVKK